MLNDDSRAVRSHEVYKRRISPDQGELGRLRQPLTTGERMVFDLFHRTLAPQWEIYLQPALNGLRPDFVLLNPRVGIAVFEVKDWNLDAMDRFVRKRQDRRPELFGRDRTGREFSLAGDDPVAKVFRYGDIIFDKPKHFV